MNATWDKNTNLQRVVWDKKIQKKRNYRRSDSGIKKVHGKKRVKDLKYRKGVSIKMIGNELNCLSRW